MAAWGVALPFSMRAARFRKHGCRKADRIGIQVLLWKPFAPDAVSPRWNCAMKHSGRVPGVASVVAFVNVWRQAMNLVAERARRAAAGFGDRVTFQIVETSDRATLLEWRISDALFIDGKQVRPGPRRRRRSSARSSPAACGGCRSDDGSPAATQGAGHLAQE
ncbi:TPA: hypothetical protein DCY65_00505 [Candidatus Acetothermia bacterium]|nr:hypothetical protein [Candidatus Acetothermia bacterium]